MAREILHTAAGEIAREGGAPEEMERGWVRDEPEVSRRRREGGESLGSERGVPADHSVMNHNVKG